MASILMYSILQLWWIIVTFASIQIFLGMKKSYLIIVKELISISMNIYIFFGGGGGRRTKCHADLAFASFILQRCSHFSFLI